MARDVEKKQMSAEYKKTKDPEGVCLFDLGDKKGKFVANISDFNGERTLEVRKWVLTKEGEWVRTKNGLSCPLKFQSKLLGGLSDFIEVQKRKAQRSKLGE